MTLSRHSPSFLFHNKVRFGMYRLLASTMLISLLFGCSDSQIGDVYGTVTLDGQPVQGAMVLFEPVEQGRPSLAITDSAGDYRLNFSADQRGAAIGDYTVRITTVQDAVYDDSGKVAVAGVKERIPSEYNRESTQKVTVSPGENQFDFAIASSSR